MAERPVRQASGNRSTVKWMLLGILLFSIVYLLGMGLAKAYLPYQYRCLLMPCEPASWKTIQDLVIEHEHDNGKNYLFSSLAFDVRNENGLAPEVPDDIEISVNYIDPEISGNGSEIARTRHERSIIFNDRKLWAREYGLGMWTSNINDLPSAESQKRFLDVKIGPRDAYTIIANYLKSDLKKLNHANFELIYDKDQETQAEKFVWVFEYIKADLVVFYIDAQTGKIFLNQLEKSTGNH